MTIDRTVNRRQVVKSSVGIAGGAALAASILAARPASAQDEQVELTFMHWGDLNEKKALENVIAKFEEEYPNIRIDQRHTPDNYDTKLNTLAAANELPDLFHQGTGLAHTWAAEGRVADLTPYLDDHPGFRDRLPETFFYFEEGRTFGTMNAAEIAMLFYNTELVEAANISPPPSRADDAYSWDEFVEVAKELTVDRNGRTANDPDFDGEDISQFGVSFPRGYLGWYPLVKSNGGDLVNEDGTEFLLNRPESVEVLQNLADLIYVHKVAPTPSQLANLPAHSIAMQTHRVAMLIHGQWNLMSLKEAEVPVGVGVLPSFGEPTTIIEGSPTCVSGATQYLDEAFAFWLYHNDPEKNADLYRRGLMMPLEEKYYTDPEFIDYWTDNDSHPEGYIDAGVNYLKNNAVPAPHRLKDWNTVESRISAGLDPIWFGETDAQTALDAMAPIVEEVLKGRYPTGNGS